MSISFQNNLSQAPVNTTSYRQTTQTPAQKMQAARTDVSKNLRVSEITEGTKPYKQENDAFLRKVQFAQTKADALGEYLGAMQNAVRESGSNGVMAAKRVGNFIDTEQAFEQSAIYKNKKDKDTFLVDQIAAMEKKQQEMEEAKAAAEEKEEDGQTRVNTASTETNVRSESEANALRSSANKITSTTGTSSSKNADAQKNAAKLYKVNDNPKKTAVTDIFTGMI